MRSDRTVATGRTAADAPEIDGIVEIATGRRKLNAGQFVDVRITSAAEHDLRGTCLRDADTHVRAAIWCHPRVLIVLAPPAFAQVSVTVFGGYAVSEGIDNDTTGERASVKSGAAFGVAG